MLDELDESARRRFESDWREDRAGPIEEYLGDPDSPTYLPTLEELVHIELEFRWRADASAATQVEDFLQRFPALNQAAIVSRLVEQECFVRHRFGDQPDVDEFRQRFPDDAPDVAQLAAIARRGEAGREEHGAAVRPGVEVEQYRVDSEHARGGFGLVFEARDRSLDRTVALKQLNRRVAEDPEFRRRFLAEARIAAALDHPGVVPVYGLHGEESGEPFYAMKMVHGVTLADSIREFHEAGAASVEIDRVRLLQSFLTVARTMAFAHSRRVIHRDLKPANIILGEYGETVILDWGLAKRLDDAETVETRDSSVDEIDSGIVATQRGSVLGTPVYMSPEQAMGEIEKIDERADVFALGAILYEILTGRRPHEGKTSAEVIENVVAGSAPPPRAIVPDIPRPLEAICLRAIAPDREERYRTSAGLAEDVELHLADLPVSAYDESAFERIARWARRHRKTLVMGSAALLLLAVVMTVAALLIDQQRRRAEQAEEVARDEQRATAVALAEARLQLYIATINRVDREWSDGHIGAAARLLDECPEEHRGWTWRLLRRRVHGHLLEFEEHDGPMGAAHFSPDGTLVASAGGPGGEAGQLLIWDSRSGAIRHRLDGHDEWIDAIDFSPDGQLLLTAGGDRVPAVGNNWLPGQRGEAIVWDVEAGELMHHLSVKEFVQDARFTRNGEKIVVVTAHRVALFEAATGLSPHEEPTRFDFSGGRRLEFDERGDHLLVMDQTGRSQAFHVGTGKPVSSLGHPEERPGQTGFGRGGVFIPVIQYDPLNMGWSPELFRLASIDGRMEKKLGGRMASVTDAVFSPDGFRLAVATVDGSVHLWALGLYEPRPWATIHAHAGPADFVRYSADGKRMLSGGRDGAVRVWDGSAPHGERRISGDATAVAVHPDGSRIIDTELRIFDTVTGELLLDLNKIQEWVGYICFVQWRADGRRIVAVKPAINLGETVRLFLYDGLTGNKIRSIDTGLTGGRVARFLPDGRLACAGADGTIRLFPEDANAPAVDLPTVERLIDFGVTPDGRRIITAGDDGAITILDVEARKVERRLEKAHVAGAGSVAVRADGKAFATGAADGEIRIHDLSTGNLVHTLTGHTAHVISLRFTDGGRRLISLGLDHTLRTWDVESGREILSINAGDGEESGLAGMDLSLDGRILAYVSNTIHVLDTSASTE